MPAITLYARRWHFSSDIVAVPALLSAFFHAAWILILLVYAGATHSWPRACATDDGVAYVAVFSGLLFCYALNLVIDLALTFHSLRGAPFEAGKRRWVVPLLYAATLPLVAALCFTLYGSYVATHLEPDCWPLEQRNAVTNLAQGLVFSSWGFMAVASLGIAITYNMYPQHHDLSSWEARCECLASALCCHANVVRRPDGKRPPLTNIAELTAGLLSHCDLDATDMTAALFLASAAQNRRRRLRIAKALLPVYQVLRQERASPGGSAAADEGEDDEDDGASVSSASSSSSLNDIPLDRELDKELDRLAAEQQARQLAAHARPAELAPAGHSLAGSGQGQALQQQQQQQQQQEAPAAAERRRRGRGKSLQAAAEQLAGELLQELPRELPDGQASEAGEIVGQLAEAIEEEIAQLGGGQLPEDALLQVAKEDSLDLSALEVNPEAPTIWFSHAGSSHPHAPSSTDRLSELGGAAAATEAVAEADLAAVAADAVAGPGEGGAEHGAGVGGAGPPGPAAAEQVGDSLAAASPFFSASGAAGAAGGKVARPASEAASGSVAATPPAKLSLQKQLTVKYPVVITPSEHADAFRGPLPAAALADIYAGRHDKVPSTVLREAVHFLKFSYAVYSLEPRVEAPASALDICACLAAPPDPSQLIFKGLSELEALEDDASVELLHLNCSNRVLAHLPYMICLDHGKHAVVVAIRGTISAADIVTDAIVYPEPLDSFLPPDIKEELTEPAFAHAGMVAAARAIFQDMTERGILQQLVEEEAVGDYTAPQGQQAQRGGSTAGSGTALGGPDGGGGGDRAARVPSPPGRQYDADAGSSGPGASQYRLGHGGRGGQGSKGQAGTGASAEQQPVADAGTRDAAAAGEGGVEQAPGRRVGEIMRQKIQEEGWQLIVEGHSLGAGAAALVSLKLRQHFPGLKCIAYSCPGGLVSKNLAHAMAPFTTTVVVGKDAVCRATVGNLARLMDEMVTALARCRQPKLAVLFWPWWRRRRADFHRLFYDYDEIPPEPLEVLHRYYDSRARIGQPLSMYPPGRLIFLRPIKTRVAKEWDAVWIRPEDIIAEGLLVSPHALRDHLLSTVYEALTAAASRMEDMESGAPGALSGEAEARPAPAPAPAPRRPRVRGPAPPLPRSAAQRRWRQRLQAQRSGSLQAVLIEAT
ncbi:hypothetical protein ABPG75_010925 [Micractinium tetrahymenae]